MDLINCKDTICYLESKHYDFLISYKKNLNKNGILLFQYIQKQLLKKNQNYFDYNVKKSFRIKKFILINQIYIFSKRRAC